MLRTLTRALGRLRLARGRCPACASAAPEACPVCFGFQAPHPPDEQTLRRWSHRYETGRGVSGKGSPAPARVWPAADAAAPLRGH